MVPDRAEWWSPVPIISAKYKRWRSGDDAGGILIPFRRTVHWSTVRDMVLILVVAPSFRPPRTRGLHGRREGESCCLTWYLLPRSRSFHNHCQCFSASNTETGETPPDIADFHGMEQSRKDPRTCGADRMAQRNRPTMNVHPPRIES